MPPSGSRVEVDHSSPRRRSRSSAACSKFSSLTATAQLLPQLAAPAARLVGRLRPGLRVELADMPRRAVHPAQRARGAAPRRWSSRSRSQAAASAGSPAAWRRSRGTRPAPPRCSAATRRRRRCPWPRGRPRAGVLADSVALRTPRSAAHLSQRCSVVHLASLDLLEEDHRLALVALLAGHARHRLPRRGHQHARLQGQQPVGARRPGAGCASPPRGRSGSRAPAPRRSRAGSRCARGRGCPTARRPGPPRARWPGRAPPPPAAARRRTAASAGAAGRAESPTASSSSSARARRRGVARPGDQQRHHHVLPRVELPQQVVELEDEPDPRVAERRELPRGHGGVRLRRPARTSPPVGSSSAPSRCRSVLFPEPLAPMMATNSPRETLRSTPASTSIGEPSPPTVASSAVRGPRGRRSFVPDRVHRRRAGWPRGRDTAWPPRATRQPCRDDHDHVRAARRAPAGGR